MAADSPAVDFLKGEGICEKRLKPEEGNTMKKTVLAAVVMILVLATVLGGCDEVQQSLSAGQVPAAVSSAQSAIPDTAVTAEQARQIALQNAGLDEKDVVFVKTWLDMENGRLVYEVEFYSGNMEYDYDIDAQTGAIVSMDQDLEWSAVGLRERLSGSQPAISEDQAKKIALEHAGLDETDVVFVRTGLDMDDGRLIYEVEFYSGATEYDYDIDAQTGAIGSMDQEIDYYASWAGANVQAAQQEVAAGLAGPVSQEQALQIALQHAGISQNQTSRLKVKKEFDDGIEQYEIEFHVGRTEYEYEIDVNSGRILKAEKDND